MNKNTIDLKSVEGEFIIQWLDPLKGGELQKESIEIVKGGGIRNLGKPLHFKNRTSSKDWVCLLKQTNKKTIE